MLYSLKFILLIFDLNRIGSECGMRSTRKGTCPLKGGWLVGWLMVFHQWAAIRDAFLPVQPSLNLCLVCHRRGRDGGGLLRRVPGSVSQGHFVHISFVARSRSWSVLPRPKVADSQRLT